MTKIVAVIPAHMASVRFPKKILFPFGGVPMIEHVRRRALMCDTLSEVYVATCDSEIADTVQAAGGAVIMTDNTHKNGTSRVAQAIEEIECTQVVLLQGDEPLLLPRHVESLMTAIRKNPHIDAWNVTGPIEHAEELDRHSFVKCSVLAENRIGYCFRRSPSTAPFETQKQYVRKILGIIAYRKDFLGRIASTAPQCIETAELIEQMRIIETGHQIYSVPVQESLPSVNEPQEADIVLDYIKTNDEQAQLFSRVVNQNRN